jgi:hypothetical protein
MHGNAPYAWTAAELAADPSWIVELPDAVLSEIEAAFPILRDQPLEALTASDCPLASFAPLAAEVREQLASGRGLVQVRRLPVECWSEQDAALAYWIIGCHLGIGVSQSYKGDRLGHVRDIDEGGRYYTVGGALEMHMDPVDVVGLLCLKRAVHGGESRLASATAVRDAIAAEYPDAIPLLERGFHYTSRREDRLEGGPPVTPHRVPVFAETDGSPSCFFLPIAIRNTEAEGIRLSAAERDALSLVDTVARRPEFCFEMDLEPGDIQLLNNRLILHGRNDYEDAVAFAEKRHMLRLWLMMPDWPPRPRGQSMHFNPDRGGGGIASRPR